MKTNPKSMALALGSLLRIAAVDKRGRWIHVVYWVLFAASGVGCAIGYTQSCEVKSIFDQIGLGFVNGHTLGDNTPKVIP
jgi:hypothetical protein